MMVKLLILNNVILCIIKKNFIYLRFKGYQIDHKKVEKTNFDYY